MHMRTHCVTGNDCESSKTNNYFFLEDTDGTGGCVLVCITLVYELCQSNTQWYSMIAHEAFLRQRTMHSNNDLSYHN